MNNLFVLLPPTWQQANFENCNSHQELDTQSSSDVPGVKAEDLKVQVEDGLLRVSGERKTAGVRQSSKFDRSSAVDSNAVEASAVKANLDAGVLTLTLLRHAKIAPKSIYITEEPVKEVLMVNATPEEETGEKTL